MLRPLGVTILAVCYFLFAALATTFGLAAIFGAGFLAQILAQNNELGSMGPAILASAGILLAAFFLGLAVLLGFLGYGMWNLRNWARTVAIVLSIVGAVFAGLRVLVSLVTFDPVSLFLGGVRLGINLLILWYLNQPHVKHAFLGGSLPPAGTVR